MCVLRTFQGSVPRRPRGVGEPVSLHRVDPLLKGHLGPMGRQAFHRRRRIFSVKTRGQPQTHPGPGLAQVTEHRVPSEATRASHQVRGSQATHSG